MADNLGNLSYTLTLDDSKFNKQIDDAAKSIERLNKGADIEIKSTSATTALETLTNIEAKIRGLKEGGTTITINPITASISSFNATTAVEGLRTQIQDAFRTINVENLNISDIKSRVKEALSTSGVPITLTCNNASANAIITQLQDVLKGHKFSISIKPDSTVADIRALKTSIETKIGELALKGTVKVDASSVRRDLSNLKGQFELPVELKIHTNTVNAQLEKLKGAFNITLNNQNLNGNSASQAASVTTQINRQNKALTDQLGIRRSINDQMSRNTQLATMLGNAMGNVFATYQVQRYLEALVEIGGEIQKQRLALGHILNDISHANELFGQMKNLAVKSPFGLLDLMQNARQLSAFGVEYNNLYDTMKRLSDVAAGLGIQFGRLSLAYGETMERGFLDGKLVRQFSYMGLPVLRKIAEYYTEINKMGDGSIVTASQVRGMVSDRLVSFEDVDAVIKKMTDVGGQFYNMQEVMAESVAGKWKNLKDAIDIMYSDIADGNSDLLKAPAEILTKLAKNYEQLIPILGAVSARFVGIKVSAALSNGVLGANVSSVQAQIVAENKLAIAEAKRARSMGLATAEQKARIANGTIITTQQFREIASLKSLTAGEKARIIISQGVTKANVEEAFSIGLIDKRQKEAVLSGAKWWQLFSKYGSAIMGMNFSMWGKMASQAISAVVSSISAMIPQLALMAAAWAAIDWFTNRNEQERQLQEYINSVKQAKEDLRKETNEISEEVQNLVYGDMTTGERSVEIKNMIEYIKNEIPDAKNILASIFEIDDNGNFKKDAEQRFNELKDVVENMEWYTRNNIDWTGMFKDAFKFSDPMSAVQDFQQTVKDNRKFLDTIIAGWSPDRRQAIFDELKTKYSKQIAQILQINEKDVKDVSNTNIETIAFMNKEMLNALIKEDNGLAGLRSNWIKSYESSWNDVVSKMAKAASNAFLNIKNARHGELDLINNINDKTAFKKELQLSIKAQYPDADGDMVNMLVNLGTNPDVLAYINTYKGNTDKIADKILQDETIRKNVFLSVDLGFNGKTSEERYQNLFGGITGKVKTEGTFIERTDSLEEQVKSSYEALEKLKKAKNVFQHVSKDSNGKWIRGAVGGLTTEAIKDIDNYIDDLNQVQKKYDDAESKAKELGFDISSIINKVDKKNTGSNGSKKEDTWLKDQKEKFDELKKTYSEFKKWSEVVGKEQAGSYLAEHGLLGGFEAKDFADTKAYLAKIYKMIEEYKKTMGSDVTRRKYLNTLIQLRADIELDISKESIKRETDKVQNEINNAIKQYDIWKVWFDATGNNSLALQMSVSVVPVWNEKTTPLKEQLQSAIGDEVFSKLDWSKDADMNAMKDLFTGDLVQYFDLFKTTYDLALRTGEELSKNTANVIKNMMSYEEKVATLEEQRRQAIAGANGNADIIKKVNGYYDSKVAELNPEYKQFISAVTTMTEEAALNMANAIKDRLVRELADGTKSFEEYSKALETVDSQLEKSRGRIKSMGEAWLLGKQSEYINTRYTNARYSKAIAEQVVASTASAVEKARKAYEQDTTSSDNFAALIEAQKANTEAIENLDKATNALTKAEKKKQKQEDLTKGTELLNASISKMNTFADGLSNIADALEPIIGKVEGLSAFSSILSGATKTASGFQNLFSMFGQQAGIYGAVIGAFVGIISASEDYLHQQQQVNDQRYEDRKKFASDLYSYASDVVKSQMGGIYNGFREFTDMEQKALEGKYNYTNQNWFKSVNGSNGKSYYDTAIATLEAQYNAIQAQSKNYQGDTKDDKETMRAKVADYELQMEEIQNQIDGLVDTILEEFYSVDFKDWASQLGDALVDAWAKGENAAKAYEDVVQDLIKSLSKSIITQSIVESMLEEPLAAFKKKLAANSGIFDVSLVVDLANTVASLAPQMANAVTTFAESMKQAGYDMSESSNSSSTANSIKGVSEETADILAALLTGMRLDLSLQRTAVEGIATKLGVDMANEQQVNIRRIADKICSEDDSMVDPIAQQQLTQLQNIASYTYRNAEAAENIQSLLDAVSNGTKELHIA